MSPSDLPTPKPFMNRYLPASTSHIAYASLSCITTRRYLPSSVNVPPSGSRSRVTLLPLGPYRRTESLRNWAACFHAPVAKLAFSIGYVLHATLMPLVSLASSIG